MENCKYGLAPEFVIVMLYCKVKVIMRKNIMNTNYQRVWNMIIISLTEYDDHLINLEKSNVPEKYLSDLMDSSHWKGFILVLFHTLLSLPFALSGRFCF